MSEGFRRKAPRRDYSGLLGVLHSGIMSIVNCKQVGEGGALLEQNDSTEGLNDGDNIVITLFFPKIGGIVAQARCLYKTDQGHIGIAFQTLSTDFKKRIREYVSRQKI